VLTMFCYLGITDYTKEVIHPDSTYAKHILTTFYPLEMVDR